MTRVIFIITTLSLSLHASFVKMLQEYCVFTPEDFYMFVSYLSQEQANHFFSEYLVNGFPVVSGQEVKQKQCNFPKGNITGNRIR
jgi:hypothetical protein